MPSDTPLHKAANSGDLGKCKGIIEEGEVEIDAPGASDRRPLHRAAGGNHPEIVAYFLEKGANVDIKDKSGRTPLHWACIGGHTECAKLLLDAGASVNEVTSSSMTPIHGAAEGGRVEVVRLLMQHKADSTMKDGDGKTAFDLAVAGKHKALCKALKELGDPQAQSASCVIQ